MADEDSYSQQLEMPPQELLLENQKTQSKFNSHFFYKALSVAIVLVLLPLFPAQAPEFINQTIFTRSWELLHLLFVGIAVSYGLFSRRNVEETEKEDHFKTDTTQAYMSRILQVSSVFDEELENPFVSDDNKAQTWSSKYSRGNPVVVVEPENPIPDEQSATISSIRNKPLLLPLRSLRSAVSDSDSVESVGEPEHLGSISRTASGSRRSSSGGSDRPITREFGDLDPLELGEKLKESVVLPSPIPWRSRSGRMEMKEEAGDASPPPYSLPPSADEPDFDQHEFRSFASPVHHMSHSNSASPSPNKLSPSPSLSPDMRAKNMEDTGKKKKNGYKSSAIPPPPPPPPPPAPVNRKPSSILPNSRLKNDGFLSEKNVKRSFSNELKDLNKGARDDFPRGTDYTMDYSKSESMHKSQTEASSMGRSVRTIRGSETNSEAKKYREFDEWKDEKPEKRSKEVDKEFVDKPRRKTVGYNQPLMTSGNQNGEVPFPMPKPTLPKYQKKRKKKLAQKIILESEEYSTSEADDDQGNSDAEKASSDCLTDAGPDPNEVDKKADEFIAKFREQIRLQRIESIKRSSGQRQR